MGKVWLAVQPLALAILIGTGVLLLLWFVSRTVWIWVDVVVALILSSAMSPVIQVIQRPRFPPGGWRIPRGVALIIVYIFAALIIGIGGLLVVSLLIGEVISIGNNLPFWGTSPADILIGIARALRLPPELIPSATQLSAELRQAGSALIASAAAAVPNVVTFVTELIIVLTLAAFLILGSESALDFVVSLAPPRHRDQTRLVMQRMGSALGSWILGIGASMVVVGTLSAIVAAVLGLPAPVLFGLFSATLELTPMLGQILMVIPAVLTGLLQSPLVAFEAAIAFALIAVLDVSIISPLVAGRSVRLSPIVVALAIPIGATLYGGTGAVLSIPVTGALQIFLQEVILPWLHRHQEAAGISGTERPNRAA